MADRDGVDLITSAQTQDKDGVSKRRRNLSNKVGPDRLKGSQTKSPKRRPATPEPERRLLSDESEKEVSDVESKPKSTNRSRYMRARGRERGEIIKRTRSKERPPQKDTTTEIEDDFEVIRQLHKSKELEDEKISEELKKKNEEVKLAVKALKVAEVKEMPPLIMAPPETKKKRVRPKTLPVPLTEEIPVIKPRARSRSRPRKVSTSDEEDERNLTLKGKLTLKPKAKEEPVSELRKRKITKKKSTQRPIQDDNEHLEVLPPSDEKKVEENKEAKAWFFQRWFSQGSETNEADDKTVDEPVTEAPAEEEPEKRAKEPENTVDEKVPNPELEEEEEDVPDEKAETEVSNEEKVWFLRRLFQDWKSFTIEYSTEYEKIRKLKNKCACGLLLMLFYCGVGGFIFRFTEGAFESFYKCGVKRVKRDFIDSLWGFSQYMPMEDWKSQARRKLMDFENELHAAHEAGMTSYSGQKSWSFLNAVVYSLTVVTTIGYGHISPATVTGRAITIVYAIIGIPMFLILLADFGKLFTRGIKFLWAFVRRLYYTGSCKKVRRTAPMQEMMKGVQLMYDFARRSSQMPGSELPTDNADQTKRLNIDLSDIQDLPETPAASQFEIDDEFNLPISVAITILVIYILIGATIYCTWEEWSFFESFYFVFISMSTIGFGDYVPNHPMYMMASMIYLVFGLALTSMCINVVQEKLSDTFRQASAKIGATIGIDGEETAAAVEATTSDEEAIQGAVTQ